LSPVSARKAWATPTRLVVMSFLSIIILGTILLMLPWSTFTGTSPAFIDALFTATSAVCVTGLIVVNTATYWALFGKIVILGLIQAGGLGLMAFASAHALVTGRRIGLWERMMIQEQTGQWNLSGLVRLMRRILLATLFFELMGGIILGVAFGLTRGLPVLKAAFFGLFHAVSAFCNAGFDILGNSLVDYVDNATVNLTVTSLIIFGGLGFHVLADLWVSKGKWQSLSLHSRIVLKVTVVFLLLGTALVFLLERGNPYTLMPLSSKGKLLASWFHSVTPRTAGFNTLPTDKFLAGTSFFVIGLMFVGASPGGTGGGIKTTTFYAVLRYIEAVIRGQDDVTSGKRRLPGAVVNKALAVLLISLGVVITSTFILTVTENAGFLDILFEVVSAFGTVGLSRGITPSLTVVGKCVIIGTMFAGRVGPLSLAIALSRQVKGAEIRYPEEKVSVG